MFSGVMVGILMTKRFENIDIDSVAVSSYRGTPDDLSPLLSIVTKMSHKSNKYAIKDSSDRRIIAAPSLGRSCSVRLLMLNNQAQP